jgi:hypothetical protein
MANRPMLGSGVDGVRWEEYDEYLGEKFDTVLDGTQGLGIATREDEIAQRTVVEAHSQLGSWAERCSRPAAHDHSSASKPPRNPGEGLHVPAWRDVLLPLVLHNLEICPQHLRQSLNRVASDWET